MSGEDQARETADKLRKATEEKKEAEKKETALVKSQLAEIQANPELAKLYNDNAEVGADNLSGEAPLLKVTQAGKSKNVLFDNTKAQDGYFFYKPTQTQYKDAIVHILTISHGFYAPGMNGQGKKFNQVMGGVLINDGDMKPFLMYFSGKRLKPLWEFGKIAAKFTKRRPVGIPLFALTVQMTTRSEENDYGESWLIDFDIMRDTTNEPILVTDPKEFVFLRDHVAEMTDTIESMISAKQSEEDETAVEQRAGVAEVVRPAKVEPIPGVEPSDIPF